VQQAQHASSQQLQQQAEQTAAAAAAAQQQQQQQQQAQAQAQHQALQQAQAQAQAQVQQSQQSQQAQQAQPQSASLYTDPTFHQYYAQHLAEAAGFPQAAGPTPEQRQAYYQQIEREQLQWLQRQTSMPVTPQGAPQPIPGQYSAPRLPSSHVSPQTQQQQIHDMAGGIPPKSEHGGD
ncbi:hypothetical protein GGH13_009128, partial [Coemansia sp. S155-1]